MNFCNRCGARVVQRIPDGDNLPRWICDSCGTIHYENPRMIVGCVCEWEGKILLCKRAIEPRYGLWTVPAGFLENGETTAAGAQRETLEEANARVAIDDAFSLYNLPHINQVYLLFRGHLVDSNIGAGSETLEARLFDEGEIPWNELAFVTVRNTLQHYLSDRRAGHFSLHTGTIEPMKKSSE